jgi:hypothetical protein
MRVRITRRPRGEADGIALNSFRVGAIYDVNASIGTYLMVSGCAEAVADMSPAEIVSIDLTCHIGETVKRITNEASVRRSSRKKR